MKSILIYLIVCLGVNFFFAQTGCTDPQATNYNTSAVNNDGSCIYPVTFEPSVFRCAFSSSITESSGLEWIDGNLFTFNDSGGSPDLYCIDTTNCSILFKIHVTNSGNTDWEDITADSNYIYIGDFGNNNGTRTDLKILKVDKSQLIGQTAFTHTVTAQFINFSYNDQTSFTSSSSNNFDCESVISIRDSLYIFTKDRGDSKTRVYKLPKNAGTYPVSPFTNYNVGGWITGADYNPFSKEVILIGYLSNKTNSFLYYLNDFQNTSFFSGNKRRIEIGNSNVWQTEGVAFYNETDTNTLFISCESAGSISSGVYKLKRSDIISGITANDKMPQYLTVNYLANGNVQLNCTEPINTIELINLTGQAINTNNIVRLNDTSFILNSFGEIVLKLVKIHLQNGVIITKKIIN